MIVDCAIYHSGGRVDVDGDISDALDAAVKSHDGSFCWIGLHEPTSEEFDLVAEELGLHPLAVEDAVTAHQRPKWERYGDIAFVVCKALVYDDAAKTMLTGEVMVFLGANFIVTVRHGEANPLKGLRRRLEADKEMLRYGPPVVLYGVLDAAVDAYVETADTFQGAVHDIEEEVLLSGKGQLAPQIYALKREGLRIHGAVDPLIPVLKAMSAGDAVRVNPEVLPFFRDVHDHAVQVEARVASLNELLPQVMAAYLAQVGVQQNNDMRRISAWAAIITAPTMIAGVYGMNFDYMPELRQSWGYPAVLLFMVTVCTTLFVLFRRNKWL
ncbi:magnesium/cobalt transporter CorA [Streptomonospora nanhaiensis]|uniref:Magnesium transport protein CorA n=1 Tax=Streptomonospora nanhaiensis TaxID=1323731 RepID=A0A853BTE0_9ACTN|nr:magnesium/cobalt transporter CorA [Streptomonospora nanhaiensis]MBV2365456.1 magnesium/cobalt transporter CorA [Streptomonospora nanhaiensis]MBX9391892.1 magnesium/cobalt transporter CorA [Streptomonospora nanhaiensis]NYI98403.1 magnesium transporter [Streptomonospora nanhaiensis]